MSGFCSEPDSANSFSMIALVEHEPRVVVAGADDVLRVPSVSKPGKYGAGSRLPVASSHSDDGPGMIRIAVVSGQIGSQLRTPST